MLTNILPAPTPVTPTLSAPIVTTTVPAVTSGVRLASYAVASTPAEGRIENQLRGSVSTPASPLSSEADVSAATSSAGGYASSSASLNVSSIRYSSQFLAQIFAQLPAQDSASLQVQLATENVPSSVLDVRLIELFTQTKYKPSNASKPPSPPSGVAALLNAAEAASSRQAIVNTPTVAAVGVPTAANNNTQIRAASNDNRPAFVASVLYRSEPSLVRETGVKAYFASSARNEANLRSSSIDESADVDGAQTVALTTIATSA